MAATPNIDPSQSSGLGRLQGAPPPRQNHQFRHLLDQYKAPEVISDLKFSSHALQRLERRGIQFGASEHSRILSGVNSLAQKGVKEGLVVMDQHRFVVSVANKTVITALNAKDQDVYSNIQGVVFS